MPAFRPRVKVHGVLVFGAGFARRQDIGQTNASSETYQAVASSEENAAAAPQPECQLLWLKCQTLLTFVVGPVKDPIGAKPSDLFVVQVPDFDLRGRAREGPHRY